MLFQGFKDLSNYLSLSVNKWHKEYSNLGLFGDFFSFKTHSLENLHILLLTLIPVQIILNPTAHMLANTLSLV